MNKKGKVVFLWFYNFINNELDYFH
jgi:hypothetical protein